jgi:hypothetical protein
MTENYWIAEEAVDFAFLGRVFGPGEPLPDPAGRILYVDSHLHMPVICNRALELRLVRGDASSELHQARASAGIPMLDRSELPRI